MAVIDLAAANAVLALIADGTPRRRAAEITGISRPVISDIANGTWFRRRAAAQAARKAHRDRVRRQTEPVFDAGRVVRCETCGALVHPPCLECARRTAGRLANHIGRLCDDRSDRVMLACDLPPDADARRRRILSEKRARGELRAAN